MNYNDVFDFWFNDAGPEKWYVSDPDFDKTITDRFLGLHQKAANGELFAWRKTAIGSLAEIIILDQFSRNMFRGTAKAFSYDGVALILAQNAVMQGMDQDLTPQMRSVLYLPYMHSESLVIHNEAIKLYDNLGLEAPIKFEKLHYDIIKEFGRYPHRNQILGRENTEQEIEFLKENPNGF